MNLNISRVRTFECLEKNLVRSSFNNLQIFVKFHRESLPLALIRASILSGRGHKE
jgi:hypothetical protein